MILTARFKNFIVLFPLLTGITVIVFGLSGCAVGPDFKEPILTNQSEDSFLDIQTTSQIISQNNALQARWWTVFHSPDLDQQLSLALSHNLSLEAARASLKSAQEQEQQAWAALFPQLSGSLQDSRQRYSGASQGQSVSSHNTYSLSNASLILSYVFDLGGGNWRALEAVKAAARYQDFEYEAARLTLSSNLVSDIIQKAALMDQKADLEEILLIEKKQLQIISSQLTLGSVSETDQLSQKSSVARAETLVTSLEKQIAQLDHLISVLMGKIPQHIKKTDDNSQNHHLESFTLPEKLPLQVPSALIRHRPDIRAAEELLHQASANLGVAIAKQFPQITLTAQTGRESLGLTKLFPQSGLIYSVGGGVIQPLFNWGLIQHGISAAEAQLEQAQFLYQNTVLQSFQNVADVLQALQSDNQNYINAQTIAQSALKSYTIAQKQKDLGAISLTMLMKSQQNWLQVEQNLVQAKAAMLLNTVALFQAMGGDWWIEDDGTQKSSHESASVFSIVEFNHD